jgi:hypothetical protein
MRSTAGLPARSVAVSEQVRPESVRQAEAWLLAQGSTYGRDSLRRALKEAGYSDDEILQAFLQVDARARAREAERVETERAGPDLRTRAGLVSVAGYALALVVGMGLFGQSYHGSAAGLAPFVGLFALPALVLSLLIVGTSDGLRLGMLTRPMAVVLAALFVGEVVLAGSCVAMAAAL